MNHRVLQKQYNYKKSIEISTISDIIVEKVGDKL